jgi:hypothetical protein
LHRAPLGAIVAGMRSRRLLRRAVVAVGVVGGLALPAAAEGATVSLWHMDETSGTTMHDAVGANNGTLTNVGLGARGALGHAYGFNGSSSIATVPSAASLNPGPSDFTASIRVLALAEPSVTVGDYDLIRKGLSSTSGGEWKIEVLRGPNGAGVASCHLKGSSGSATITAGPPVTDGRWHTIVCAKRATGMALFVDAAGFGKSVTIGSISNSAKLTIGAKNGGGDWTQGLLDEATWSMP